MVGRIFLWLFWACRHQWKTIGQYTINEKPSSRIPCGDAFIQRCTKCGTVRRKDLT